VVKYVSNTKFAIIPEGVNGANVLKCDFLDADHV